VSGVVVVSAVETNVVVVGAVVTGVVIVSAISNNISSSSDLLYLDVFCVFTMFTTHQFPGLQKC